MLMVRAILAGGPPEMVTQCLRSFASQRFGRRRKVNNPGISHHLQILREDNPDVLAASPEDLEELEHAEMDFMNARELAHEHARQVEGSQKYVKFKMIERKFDRPPRMPNMLSWSEKEQIRLLNAEDREKWNVQKLAECFPATPENIQKVIKAQWRPESPDRVELHDRQVSENWRAFDEGRLEGVIDINLKKHLAKFTSRKHAHLNKPETQMYEKQPPSFATDTFEFGEIINAYTKSLKGGENEGKADHLESNTRAQMALCSPQPQLVYSDRRQMGRKMHYTLDELRVETSTADDGKRDISLEDREFLKGATETVRQADSVLGEEKSKERMVDKTNQGKLAAVKFFNEIQVSVSTHDHITPFIAIPKSKWQKGGTYKVKDCYYDDDGGFLYRVPGMVGSRSVSEQK